MRFGLRLVLAPERSRGDLRWPSTGYIRRAIFLPAPQLHMCSPSSESPAPAPEPNNPSPIAAERARLAGYIGTRENAGTLFRSKVAPPDVETCGRLILQQIDFQTGTNILANDFTRMSESDVVDWGIRCWANTVAHLCETDAAIRSIVATHDSCLPDNPSAQEAIMGRVHAEFLFFLWVLAGPTRPLNMANSCYIKLIVLRDVILLENIQAKRDGAFGGWGLLDKTIAGLRDVASGFEIRRIKSIATNDRVYQAMLRRGFRDQTPVPGLTRHIENFSRPVELALG